jgi:hypothetical protein
VDRAAWYIVSPNVAPAAKPSHADTAATANNGNIIVPP